MSIMDLNMTITLLFLALLFLIGLVFTKSSTSTTHIDEVQFATNKKKKKMRKMKSCTGTGTGTGDYYEEDNSRKEAELKSVFATFDKNRDGFITKQELRESLENIGMSASDGDAVEMVEKVDANGDGLIDFEEFRQLFESMMAEKKRQPESEEEEGELKEAFGVFDGDKDGLISVEELGLVLDSLGFKEGKRLDACKEMIRKVDIDGDGMVSFFEFKCMMKSGTSLISI